MGHKRRGDLGQVESGGHRDTAIGTSKIIGQEGLNRLLMWEERPGRKALDLQTTTKSDKFNLLRDQLQPSLGVAQKEESAQKGALVKLGQQPAGIQRVCVCVCVCVSR